MRKEACSEERLLSSVAERKFRLACFGWSRASLPKRSALTRGSGIGLVKCHEAEQFVSIIHLASIFRFG